MLFFKLCGGLCAPNWKLDFKKSCKFKFQILSTIIKIVSVPFDLLLQFLAFLS